MDFVLSLFFIAVKMMILTSGRTVCVLSYDLFILVLPEDPRPAFESHIHREVHREMICICVLLLLEMLISIHL